jgi:hypothetical protein
MKPSVKPLHKDGQKNRVGVKGFTPLPQSGEENGSPLEAIVVRALEKMVPVFSASPTERTNIQPIGIILAGEQLSWKKIMTEFDHKMRLLVVLVKCLPKTIPINLGGHGKRPQLLFTNVCLQAGVGIGVSYDLDVMMGNGLAL